MMAAFVLGGCGFEGNLGPPSGELTGPRNGVRVGGDAKFETQALDAAAVQAFAVTFDASAFGDDRRLCKDEVDVEFQRAAATPTGDRACRSSDLTVLDLRVGDDLVVAVTDIASSQEDVQTYLRDVLSDYPEQQAELAAFTKRRAARTP